MHKYRSIGVCLSSVLLFLTSVSATVLIPLKALAIHVDNVPIITDIIDVITINVPVSCSMSASGTDSHTASVNNGQTTENIGTTNLKVICNDNSGYAIYAIGYTDDTYGKTVLTSSTLGSTHDIATATTVSTGTSSWAMKLASVSGTYAPIIAGSTGDSLKVTGDPDFSDYTAVPQEYTKVAYHTSSTDTGNNATGSNLTTTYRAYVSPSQPAGTYIGQVKYTLVHPNTHAAPVVYNTNADDISEVTYLQEFAAVNGINRQSIINSMTTGTQYTLTDSRDGKTYTIAKLADGNVWMTQNLDLDLDSAIVYTNEDTDIGYNTTTGEYDTASWSPTRSTYAATNTQTHEWCAGGTWNTQDDYCEQNYTPESYDPGNLYWNLATDDNWTDWYAYYNTCDYSSNPPVCNQSSNPISTYTSSTGTAQYHLGNYYNWTAAVAMNDSSSHTTSGELIEQSICPAGWTLPRIGDGDDTFLALWEEYGYDIDDGFSNISTVWTSPLYFVASGSFDGVLGNVGGGGYFWSPVVDNSFVVRGASYGVNGGVNPSGGGYRLYGNSIRCVARPVSGSISESSAGGMV